MVLETSQSERLTNEDFRKLISANKKKDRDLKRSEKHLKRQRDNDSKTNQKKFKEGGKTDEKKTVDNDEEKNRLKSINKDDSESYNERRKRKMYFAKLKKEEEEREKILAAKYRDRAKERREGENPDYQNVDLISATSGYKAVAPDSKTTEGAAERRKQMIQESKFLGGDMEHTHLVKGLDYALLQKVRSELTVKGKYVDEEEIGDDDERMDKQANDQNSTTPNKPNNKKTSQPEFLPHSQRQLVSAARDPLAKAICRALYGNQELPRVNELFAVPRRLAYVFDMKEQEEEGSEDDDEEDSEEGEEEHGDEEIDSDAEGHDTKRKSKKRKKDRQTLKDIPTTLLRSKSECPVLDTQTTLTTNDIVINKLTQILSYLRQGVREHHENKANLASKLMSKIDDSIYGDIGDYVPASSLIKVKQTSLHQAKLKQKESMDSYKLSASNTHARDKVDEVMRKASSYFQDTLIDGNEDDRLDVGKGNNNHDPKSVGYTGKNNAKGNMEDADAFIDSTIKMVQEIGKKFKAGLDGKNMGMDEKDQRYLALLNKETKASKKDHLSLASASTNTYAECYPGYHDSAEAIYDSEDEVDFTKMDLGNKKGPVGRWDFDTPEEYSSYMSTKEALPKAAFQYGVKMNDGRKTRRTGPKDEKMKLDQEWQKISKIIQKRKD
ncbi:unnamed protein product [Gordionus sp. m RMFG-2023]